MVMKQTGEIYIQPKTKIKQNKTNKQTKQNKTQTNKACLLQKQLCIL